MKTKLICFVCFLQHFLFAQDSIPSGTKVTHTQIFSLSPISKKVDTVNGLVLGVGHYQNQHIQKQTINGLNVDVNPVGLGLPLFLIYLPDMIKKGTISSNQPNLIVAFDSGHPQLQMNGINLSAGCFFTETNLNGLNVSLMNRFRTLNGISITVFGTQANVMNGVSMGFYNGSNTSNGFNLALLNETIQLNGIQMGVYNYAQNGKGIQIGLFNVSRNRGLQLGVWNVNNKRSMPFINW